MSVLFRPVELAYRAVTRVKRALYRAGVVRAKRLPRKVISIGNLTFGGSGKTPTVIAVARFLGEAGLRVAILSRGHGRRDVSAIELVTSDDADRFGDEPVLLSKRLAGVDVVVGADRTQAGEWYLRDHDCDVFLLDDGFQHLRLARDVDVVLVGESRAPLREGTAALRDADVLLRRGSLRQRIPEKPLFDAALVPVGFRWRGEGVSLDAFRGKKIYAFAALADNDQFFASLEQLGLEIVGRHGFRDHHPYTIGDISMLRAASRAAGAELLVTTEKDAVKLRDDEIAALEVEMEIDRRFFDDLRRRISA